MGRNVLELTELSHIVTLSAPGTDHLCPYSITSLAALSRKKANLCFFCQFRQFPFEFSSCSPFKMPWVPGKPAEEPGSRPKTRARSDLSGYCPGPGKRRVTTVPAPSRLSSVSFAL